jgi:hypothetical protein
MLGWIQLVQSTDNRSGGDGFDLDPYEPLGEQSHPFCWFGLAPTLFDAPSRRLPPDMDWIAHSFLGFVGARCEARALLGFSWGFGVRDGAIAIGAPVPLGSAAWDAHLPLLRAEHPRWQFAPGYHDR